MALSLDRNLLRISKAVSHIPGASLATDAWRRSTKAAELSAALTAAICTDPATLHNVRILYPFFHLLSPELAQLRCELPSALRGSWDGLQDGTLIAAGADLTLWRACAETAWSAFYSAASPMQFPDPAVQVTVQEGAPVILTPLNLPCAKIHIADELRVMVRCGGREAQPGIGDRVLLCGHFDPHGLAMLMASWLHLRLKGVTRVQAVCGYTETGDYGKFWKRTLPKLAAEGSFNHAVIVDMTVYAREHSRTIDALKKVTNAGTKVHLVDHHLDTLSCVRDITQTGAEVVLADIPGCFYGNGITPANAPFTVMGGIGDREVSLGLWFEDGTAPEWANDARKACDDAAALMHALSPPPSELKSMQLFPLDNLLDAASHGFNAFAAQLSQYAQVGFAVDIPGDEKPERAWFTLPPVKPDAPLVDALQLGAVLLVPAHIETAGREWYEQLEKLLAANPAAHYALAGRYLPGAGFNFLCLKDWREYDVPAPLAFVPEDERAQTLGHYGAFWFNIADASDAEARLTAFIKAINAHFGAPGGRVSAVVRKTILGLVEARADAPKARRSSADRVF